MLSCGKLLGMQDVPRNWRTTRPLQLNTPHGAGSYHDGPSLQAVGESNEVSNGANKISLELIRGLHRKLFYLGPKANDAVIVFSKEMHELSNSTERKQRGIVRDFKDSIVRYLTLL